MTRPRQTVKIATMVSIEISMGSDAPVEVCDEESDSEAEVIDCSAECS